VILAVLYEKHHVFGVDFSWLLGTSEVNVSLGSDFLCDGFSKSLIIMFFVNPSKRY
jgi:hypothetical protein